MSHMQRATNIQEKTYIPHVHKVIFMKHAKNEALNNQNEKVINQWKPFLPCFKIIYIYTHTPSEKGFLLQDF